jgi:hypothetical protein
MPLERKFVTGKNILSELLLEPRQFPEIHGVGIGSSAIDKFHLRIYVTNPNASNLAAFLKKTLELKDLPDLKSFALGDKFAAKFGPEFKNMVVEIVTAPRVVLAAKQTAVATISHFNNCNYRNVMTDISAGLSVWSGPASQLNPAIGTIGYYCQDNVSSKKYLLTCNHVGVPASVNTSGDMTNVFFRRHVDDAIAKLSAFVKLEKFTPTSTTAGPGFASTQKNYVDAAIGEMHQNTRKPSVELRRKLSATSPPISVKMNGIKAVAHRLAVTKHGFKTCWTDGVIDDVDCNFLAIDPGTRVEILYVDQFRIVSNSTNGIFAAVGDSGSLVYTTEATTNKAVGLLFGAGNQPDQLRDLDQPTNPKEGIPYALASPIERVLDKLSGVLFPGSTTKKLKLITS